MRCLQNHVHLLQFPILYKTCIPVVGSLLEVKVLTTFCIGRFYNATNKIRKSFTFKVLIFRFSKLDLYLWSQTRLTPSAPRRKIIDYL